MDLDPGGHGDLLRERDRDTEELEGQREQRDREGHTQRETGRESREREAGGDREREDSYQNPGGGLSLGSQLSCSVPRPNSSFFTSDGLSEFQSSQNHTPYRWQVPRTPTSHSIPWQSLKKMALASWRLGGHSCSINAAG